MNLGRFNECLNEYRLAHEVGSKQKEWQYPSAEWVRKAERLVELSNKLPMIAAGQVKHTDVSEMLELAEVALLSKHYEISVRLYTEALLIDAKLSEELDGPRYNAVCAAVLAGSGLGEDTSKLTDEERARWRRRALRWLVAEQAGWAKVAADPAAMPRVRKNLHHWFNDPDLAPIRDEAELMKLPAAEQAEWRKLWAEIHLLKSRVDGLAIAPPPRLKGSP
jgi:hypothetical protein